MFDQNISVKVQDLLGEFLYQHKQLTLPTIGNFELDASVNVYESKEGNLPENAIRFTQNLKATANEELMNYLVQHSGKMRPLAMSDLESYLNNGWQFLNIGKPFTIKGIGSLTKNGNTLIFQQSTAVMDKPEATGGYALKDRSREKEEIKEMRFDTEVKKRNGKKGMIAIASVTAMALISWAIYMAVNSNKAEEPDASQSELQIPAQSSITVDTTAVVPDSVAATTVVVDTSFRLVLFTFRDSTRAYKELQKQLSRRNNVTVVPKDSVFQIILTVNQPLADSAKVMDSLRIFYLLKPKLLKQ